MGFLGDFADEANDLRSRVFQLESENAKLREDAARLDHELRKALWLGHGCDALYGDDGEMQCGRCLIDFKRVPIDRIQQRLFGKKMAAIDDARKAK